MYFFPTLISCFYSFSLIFRSLIMICLGMDYFFSIFGVYSATCIYRFMFFTKFGKFSSIISLNTFLILLLFLPLWSYKCYLFVIFPQVPETLFIYFFVYFLFFRLGEFIVLSSSMILSCITSILLLSLTSEPLIFFFCYIFQFYNFHLVVFL